MSIKKSHPELRGEQDAHHLSPSTHYLSPLLQTVRQEPMMVGVRRVIHRCYGKISHR